MLTWNVFHGRSLPAAGRTLRSEFAALLASWRWDVALLQELPPWWAAELAAASRAAGACALTSRNAALPLRRALAERRPDVIKSNGGGANAILLRGAHAAQPRFAHKRLRTLPERRVAQAAWLAGGALAVNFHGSTRVALAREELERLWAWALQLARGAPLVLGGDFNLRERQLPALNGAAHLAQRDVDHVFALGFAAAAPQAPAREARALGCAAAAPQVLAREIVLHDGRKLQLSDHPPLLVELDTIGSQAVRLPITTDSARNHL